MDKFTKEDFYAELKQDAYESRIIEHEEAKRDYFLEDDYDYFCEYFSDEFEVAIDAIKELKKLHDKHGHTLEAEDLI